MAERDQLTTLTRNISIVVNQMEEDIRANSSLPNDLFLPLVEKLRSLNKVMDPQRPLVCYVVGNTNTGKSSLINKICGHEVCPVSEDDEHGTTTFSRIDVPEMNAIFVDTIGFGFGGNDIAVLKELESRFRPSGELPDVILFIITKDNLKDTDALERITKHFNNILRRSKKLHYQIELPVVCVLSKIDEYFKGQKPREQNDLEKVEEYLTHALEKINQHLCIKVQQRVAVSAWHNYHVDHLKTILNVSSPLNAQIVENNHRYFLECRRSMADIIITAFTATNAAVSMLPVVDIVIIPFINGWMFKMLACFSVDSERTATTFEALNWIQNVIHSVFRTTLLLVGDGLEMTGVAYLLGAGISVTASSLSTAKLGWDCYNYFTKET